MMTYENMTIVQKKYFEATKKQSISHSPFKIFWQNRGDQLEDIPFFIFL